MELHDFYNLIQNPIADPNVIHQLINIYGDDSTFSSNFYDKVLSQHKKGKSIGKCNGNLKNRFEVALFNKWKNEVLSMTRDQFIELHRRGSYPETFPRLRKYLRGVPDVKSIEEINQYKYGHDVPQEIKDLFEDYCYDSLGWGTGWEHISSRHINAKKTSQMKIEHRLYLNIDPTIIHRLAMEFISKCEALNVPFYFKFDLMGSRDDVMVIYSDTKHLPLFIEILNTIKKENPDINNSFFEPPMLTGKVYDWLGYGTETKDGKVSYNTKRVDAIEKAIDRTTKDWVKSNIIKMINFRDNYVHFYEYITVVMIEQKLRELKNTYKYYDDCSKNNKNGYDPNYALSHLGLKMIDIESIEFKDHLYKKLIVNMEDRIISFCENPDFEFNIDINIRDGKKLSFNKYDMERAFRKISTKIGKNDPNYEISVRDNIIEESKKVGIDKNKYCFDTYMVYKIINENPEIVRKEVPVNKTGVVNNVKLKEQVVDPFKVVSKRDMVVHTNYVPSQKLIAELQNLIDNDTDKVLTYMHHHLNAMRILVPYLVEHQPRIADMFVDDVIVRYPEVQAIYEDALNKVQVKRGI